MKRSREESQGRNNNIFVDEVPYPRLNLPLTKSQELIKLIESHLKEQCICPSPQKLPDLTENSKTSIPPQTPEKLKAMNFPIAKITIGSWTCVAVYSNDIVAKFYFAKKKLIWEFLDGPATNMARLKRKIEIQWDDVSSLKPTIHPRDETGILEVELSKRPTYFIESNPQAGKHTQWKQIDDFTQDLQSSICRRHTLHFPPGVLKKNLEKLVSSDSFWSELLKVSFPFHESRYFDIRYGNNNNNSSRYSPSQTLSLDVNNDLVHHHYHSQGIPHVNVGEGNFDMATQLCGNYGRQINSYGHSNSRSNTADELLGTQAIPPSFPVINGHYYMGRYSTNSLMMQNTREILGSQAFTFPDTQTNSTFQHVNDIPMYPEVGSYLQNLFLQEGHF